MAIFYDFLPRIGRKTYLKSSLGCFFAYGTGKTCGCFAFPLWVSKASVPLCGGNACFANPEGESKAGVSFPFFASGKGNEATL